MRRVIYFRNSRGALLIAIFTIYTSAVRAGFALPRFARACCVPD
jgi:hypothetical protein